MKQDLANVEEPYKKLLDYWQTLRGQYPGWLILPFNNRETLRVYLLYWVRESPREKSLFALAESLPPVEALLLLHELNWRLEKALIPLFIDQAEVIGQKLRRVNPFPHHFTLEDAEITTDQAELYGLRYFLREPWVNLAFALAREAREDFDTERFETWMSYLDILRHQTDGWNARWYYEKCLYYLYRLEQGQVQTCLTQWDSMPSSPEWMLKRASIYAELGNYDRAIELAEKALDEVRQGQKPGVHSYNALSGESWILASLIMYEFGGSVHNGSGDLTSRHAAYEAKRDEYQERLEKLRQYRCDPESEIGHVVDLLNKPMPRFQSYWEQRSVVSTFDPGEKRIYQTKSFRSGPPQEDVYPAFTLLRLIEEAGYPLHCPNIGVIGNLDRAAEWIWPYAPLWAISVYLRSGKKKELETWLSRARLATLDDNGINTLYGFLIPAARSAIRQLEKGDHPHLSYSGQMTEPLLEVVSRLTFRLDAQQLEQALELALEAHKSPGVQAHFQYHRPLGNLFKRVLQLLDDTRLAKHLPTLVKLSYGLSDQLETPFPGDWPEPVNYVNREANHVQISLEDVKDIIPELLVKVRHGGKEARRRAILRLTVLEKYGALGADDRRAFAEAIWCRISSRTGLPKDTGLYYFSFLFLPEPTEGKAKEAVRDYLLTQTFPRIVHYDNEGYRTVPHNPYANYYALTWLYSTLTPWDDGLSKTQKIDWSPEDVGLLIQKIMNWWDSEKAELKGDFRIDDLSERLEQIGRLFGEVVLPRSKTLRDGDKEEIRRFLDEAKELGFVHIPSVPAKLILDSSLSNQLTLRRRVRRG
jgi:hypothetical protein